VKLYSDVLSNEDITELFYNSSVAWRKYFFHNIN
jgi:hypothetical protein